MNVTPLDLSGLGTAVGSSTRTDKADSNTDPQAAQDRFLKLLVAQINSQDPLNPMDNAQMTTQMAQINTVSGIQQLNATLKGMSEQYSAMQGLQGTSLIGRQALVEGNRFSFDGEEGRGAMVLSGPASQVAIDVVGTNGELIESVIEFGDTVAREINTPSVGTPLASTPPRWAASRCALPRAVNRSLPPR